MKGGAAIPTAAQILKCYILSCMLTRMYVPVFLVRLDERTEKVVILAGEEIAIAIQANGEWRYEP